MQQVLAILLGTLCSGSTCFCLGTLLVRRLNVDLERTEYAALAFVVGSACYSQLVFLLSAISLATPYVFVAVGLFAALIVVGTRGTATHITFAPFPAGWKWLFGALFATFGIVYLVNALAPEMSPDGSAYHLPFVARYLRAHSFTRIDQNLYASLPQGIDLLFLPAVSLGGNSAASMVHFIFLLDLPLLMVSYGRRFGFPLPAAAAAFLVFASPAVGWDGTSAYVDVAAATILFALFYLLQIWQAERSTCLLTPIGILAGFSFSAKYSAAIGIPYALGLVAWRQWRDGKRWLRPALRIGCAAALLVLPWMIKNQILSGNPFAPFANRFFPNPHVRASLEQQYLLDLQHYHLTSWLSVPWELTVKGERLQGFFGPVFLLLPLALFSLRRPEGRRLWLAGMIFVLPWFLNAGARFLLPAAPPLTLALSLGLESPAGLLPAVALIHGFLSWYATPLRYFDPYAPRVWSFPLRGALRLEGEDVYLARNSPGYRVDRMIEREVPRGEKVFSLEQIPEAWTTREILPAYAAAQNDDLRDIVWTALNPSMFPDREVFFHFEPRQLRRLRAIQTSGSSGRMWSVSEFQVFARGEPVLPDGNWRLSGNPNPWDVSLAFDGRPVTRWRSWESATPGMFIDVDFGKPVVIDEAHLVTTPDSGLPQLDLRGMDVRGEWCALSAQRSFSTVPIIGDLRREAVRALVARGIRYLLVSPGAFGANDFYDHSSAWGIELVGESGGTRLYVLKPAEARLAADAGSQPWAVVPPGRYDDPDPRITLKAAWTRDTQFPDASRHTVSYSNIRDASASLAFHGNAVTYVFTRASNRGIAEVFIDGARKDLRDLYSRRTVWRSQSRYGGLGAGEHVIEIRVTGDRNPLASDCFVDIDELVVE
jgi:hypothetical protein